MPQVGSLWRLCASAAMAGSVADFEGLCERRVKKQRTSSQGGSDAGGGEAGIGNDLNRHGGSRITSLPTTLVALLTMLGLTEWEPDGRGCKLCGCKDDTDDPVWTLLPGRRWFYPPKNRKNQGLVCWVCGRVWEARYKLQIPIKLSELPGWLAGFTDRLPKFNALAGVVLTKMTSDPHVRLSWSQMVTEAEEIILTNKQANVVEMIKPDDNWMLYQDYVDEHGDPSSNGLSHIRTQMNGRDPVWGNMGGFHLACCKSWCSSGGCFQMTPR